MDYSMPIFFFIAMLFLIQNCAALDTISINQGLKDGETIVSSDSMYELGFFGPGKSKNRYLGIWFKKISRGTVVWVANRETPIRNTSGVLKVSREGNLVILSEGNNVIWSSNSTVTVESHDPVMVQLLDSGNLVVWDTNNTKSTPIWQSFDYPTDTLLAGMKLGKDLVTGLERYLTSWTSPDDPSIGVYTSKLDTNGYPQIIKTRGSVLLSRVGPWDGVGFSGQPVDVPNSVYSTEFVVDQKEIYYKYELISSVVQRIVMTWDGKAMMLLWIERVQEWIMYLDSGGNSCERFGLCGPHGSCSTTKHPPCTCIEGFEPNNLKEWEASDWSSGCKRTKPLICGSEYGFRKVSGVTLPDTRKSWYSYNLTLRECDAACRRNCSCTAYANLDIRNGGSGCLQWFDQLMDIRDYDEDHNIYIRMPASELAGHMVIKWKEVLTMVLSIFSVALLLSTVVCMWKKRKKMLRIDKQEDLEFTLKKKYTTVLTEHIDDIRYFSLSEVAKATDNFSDSSKIGEGGFGPVYKGVLEDGQEIAVKRLSETSQQGLDEFKNELNCIAKLQHRNLVKLLGYCIHGNEMILLYEYMANKSLDSFIFDDTRSSMLDWSHRFNIIHGMARGILYLHQDSRLQIIHRDLKPVVTLLQSMQYMDISP